MSVPPSLDGGEDVTTIHSIPEDRANSSDTRHFAHDNESYYKSLRLFKGQTWVIISIGVVS